MRQLKITKQVTNRETASLDKYLQEIGKVDLITAEEEVELFEEQRDAHKERKDKLEEAIDHVRAKLGAEAVKTGRRFSFEARKQKRATKNILQTDKNRQTDC